MGIFDKGNLGSMATKKPCDRTGNRTVVKTPVNYFINSI